MHWKAKISARLSQNQLNFLKEVFLVISLKRVIVKPVSGINIRTCALHGVLDISSFKRLSGFVPMSSSISLDTNKNLFS